MIKAGAIIVGDRNGPASAVYDISADLGFVFVKPFAGRPQLPLLALGAPVTFVMFAETTDPKSYEPIVHEIRRGQPRSLALAPLIYFCESPSRDVIDKCVEIGMDDIMTMPFTRDRVHQRLMRQIEAPQIYFETADYLGPDRRRLSDQRLADAFLRGIEEVRPARRLEIRRSLSAGVTVIREEIIQPHGHGAQ
jgi:hypothetical protein